MAENKTDKPRKARVAKPITKGSVMTLCITKIEALPQKDQRQIIDVLDTYFPDVVEQEKSIVL